jgi:hypothetical protein
VANQTIKMVLAVAGEPQGSTPLAQPVTVAMAEST